MGSRRKIPQTRPSWSSQVIPGPPGPSRHSHLTGQLVERDAKNTRPLHWAAASGNHQMVDQDCS
eukprot:764923-Hanusia_phi.AAC.13